MLSLSDSSSPLYISFPSYPSAYQDHGTRRFSPWEVPAANTSAGLVCWRSAVARKKGYTGPQPLLPYLLLGSTGCQLYLWSRGNSGTEQEVAVGARVGGCLDGGDLVPPSDWTRPSCSQLNTILIHPTFLPFHHPSHVPSGSLAGCLWVTHGNKRCPRL